MLYARSPRAIRLRPGISKTATGRNIGCVLLIPRHRCHAWAVYGRLVAVTQTLYMNKVTARMLSPGISIVASENAADFAIAWAPNA
jgi:hypothetical protein